MDAKTKALAQLQHWNENGYTPKQSFFVDAPKYGPKQRSLLAKLAPAAGATIGAAGIAAAPFTGGLSLAATLAAIGGGAALGGAAGEFGAQRLTHEKTNIGNILKEGAISGVTGAIPLGGVGRAARFAESAGTNLATTGAEQAAKSNLLTRAGSALRAYPRGIVAGVDTGGGRSLSLAEAKAQNAAVDAAARGRGTVGMSGQFSAVDKKIQDLANSYKTTPEAAKPFTAPQKKSLIAAIDKNISNNENLNGTLTKGNQKVLDNIKASIGKHKTNADFVDHVVKINNQASSIINKGNVGSSKVQLWEEVRNATKDFIDNSKNLAGKSSINKELSPLLGAKARLSKTITRDVTSGTGQGLTVGRVAQDIANPVAEVTGRALQKLGGSGVQAGAKAASPLSARAIGTEGAKQGLAYAILGTKPAPISEQDQRAIEATQAYNNGQFPEAQGVQDPNADPNAPANAQQQAPESPYSLQQALADIQRDPKNTDKYLSVYKTVAAAQKEAAKAAGGQGHGIISAQSYSNARSGAESLQQLAQMIQDNPSLTTKTSSPGQGLPVVGGYVEKSLGTNSYNALARNVADAVLRLRTGAQANESEIRLYMKKFLPAAGDSPADVQRKLQILQSNFTPYLSSGGPTDLSSLTDALTAVQGGQ